MQSILIAIDDPGISTLLRSELLEAGYSVRLLPDPRTLGQEIRETRVDLLVIDEFFGEESGLGLCFRFRRRLLDTQVVIWAGGISSLERTAKGFPRNFHMIRTHALQDLTREICRILCPQVTERTSLKSGGCGSPLGH